uniref:Gustatory receptor n=1 Tax=Daphnia galeata TaxID=27404 RepID=A0A8J2S994_9CRUS|nr:unnamed protein product [Daphnia galeata]
MSSSRSRMLVRTRSTISGEAVEKGWLWSVQPLVISAKCLGINLSNGNRQSTCWWFITVLVLLFFIITQFLCLKFIINNYKEISQTFIFEINNNSDTFAWNTVMDFVNFAVHSLGIHIMFVFAFRSRWCLLVEAFQNLESFSDFNFFNKIRKASILGVFWIIILQTTVLITNIHHHAKYGSSLTILFCSLLSVYSQIYLVTAIILFAVSSYASSMAYLSIRLNLNHIKNKTTDGNYYNCLLSLKRRHVIVCETVDHINNCFGYFLGVTLSFHFVAIVTASFYLFGNEKEPATILEIGFATTQICNLSLICYPADLIRNKADSVSRKLIRMQLEMEEPLKSVVNEFVAQTNQFSPQINAVGFYPISKKIIPQIVGTTLTYFFILYQFQSSEKNEAIKNV